MFAIREFGPNWEYEAISLRARLHCGFLEEYYNYTNSDLKPITEQLRIKKKKKKKKKWLLCCSYNTKFSQISFHLNELGKNLDTLTSKYDNTILLVEFNTEVTAWHHPF